MAKFFSVVTQNLKSINVTLEVPRVYYRGGKGGERNFLTIFKKECRKGRKG